MAIEDFSVQGAPDEDMESNALLLSCLPPHTRSAFDKHLQLRVKAFQSSSSGGGFVAGERLPTTSDPSCNRARSSQMKVHRLRCHAIHSPSHVFFLTFITIPSVSKGRIQAPTFCIHPIIFNFFLHESVTQQILNNMNKTEWAQNC